MKKIIGIIGGGNMGEALIKGLHRNNRIFVAEADRRRASYLRKKYRLTVADINTTVEEAGILILAVKPQDMPAVLESVRACRWGKPIISIAAGLTTRFFEKHFPGLKIPVIRCMPNMPALIGEGITAVCAGKYATPADLKSAQSVLSSVGETVVVKESMIDAVTAVSGSGPAYVFLFVEQWMTAAKKLGFKETESRQLVYQTLIGSAHLLERSEFDAATLRAKVTSKGGTTQAAMEVFLKGDSFEKLMKNALLAAKKRAGELAK
ncbi:MAG: pyrroline-5-carboxylate reductase [Candidatus Omnitrophica bacterium]|nr:pyrroline-5-carboxylate reductase [Candidatus Omnitrophota bacterium]MDE2008960.1 pyrroline-5-carboxylate reductase [Candidatus Omnitrophota bacterium]MDE2214484.1 pyrroline-5-carboxylate reductase [Candidatus Omnitrophota bacterium]MDE2230802.1 pyrroline-5-carboxylate reductase [Candidatus Omnitrophota bacterium]